MAHNEPTLKNGERLFAGQFLRSRNGLFHALMQEDGNFVVYRGDLFKTKPPGYEKTALWSLCPAGQAPGGGTGYHLYMQEDGNLCIYRQEPWAVTYANNYTSNHRAKDGRFLELMDNGRLDITGIWTTNGEVYDEMEFDHFEYVMDPAPKVTSLGAPGVSMSLTGTNSTDLVQPMDFTMSRTITTAKSFTTTSSLKIAAKTSINLEVPFIGKGTVELSTEFTQTLAWGKTDTESHTEALKITLNTKPGRTYQTKCNWKVSSFNVPYRAVGKIKFHGYPDKLPVHFEGVFEGISTHDIHAYWMDVTDHPGSAAASAALAKLDDGWHEVAWTPVPQN